MGEYMCDPFEDFMNALEHCDTVTVSLKEVGETSWDTETIYKAILRRAAYQKPTASAWRTDAPPKDGTWIVAKFPGWLEKELMHLVFWDVPEDSPGEAGWYSPDAEDIVGGGKDPIAFIAINPYEGVE